MNRSVKVCWYCPTNLDINKFQDNTIWYCLLTSILGWPSRVSPWGQSILPNLRPILAIFGKCGAHFSVGKIIYWVSNFWAKLGQVEFAGWANLPTQFNLPDTYINYMIGYDTICILKMIGTSLKVHCLKSRVQILIPISFLGVFRSVSSLTVPGLQEFHFPHFSSNFLHFFLFFLKFSSFLSSFWPSGWATRPPGKALATQMGVLCIITHHTQAMVMCHSETLHLIYSVFIPRV